MSLWRQNDTDKFCHTLYISHRGSLFPQKLRFVFAETWVHFNLKIATEVVMSVFAKWELEVCKRSRVLEIKVSHCGFHIHSNKFS